MNFKTLKVGNDLLAVYMLSIRQPTPPFPAVQTFIFPLSPQRIRKIPTAMAVGYDTAGTAAQAGVNRDIDAFGMTPFTYEIEGTTGWDRHLTDGFLYTGMRAINNLKDMLYLYAQLNQEQRLQNDPNSYILEFADFFNGEFYQVEPIGPQIFRADERSPLLQYYQFRLVGVQPISAPVGSVTLLDPIALLLAAQAPTAVADAIQLTATVLATY